MTTPITATVTKPEPTPEPVRPRLTAIVYRSRERWHAQLIDRRKTFYAREQGYREITIPTDAEIERDARIAEKHARYVAALEDEAVAGRRVYANAIDGRKALVVGYNADVLSYEDAQQRTDSARAEWEAEGGKA